MDATLLTDRRFWSDATPITASAFPGLLPHIAELKSHVLFETSGSTGAPKWIALSKAALLTSAAAVNAHLGINASSCWDSRCRFITSVVSVWVRGLSLRAVAWKCCRVVGMQPRSPHGSGNMESPTLR